ncbi:MAG: bifunctional diaminohydroxyphosphoribosylaminopyrimidine deaminase/5-amino-6-(5-phosphoribosylamino)uracil reductase RibD [Halocynthiibacter sp.]
MSSDDRRYMALALGLARRGLGQTWPNPAVGCVIVEQQGDAGRVVGRGWTQPGGRPHAETSALAQAGTRARGATVYVTLEPCAHHAKTPPCAAALISAGVGRVVSAVTDSDPRVSGQGHSMLRAAGIAVTTPLMDDAARELNRGFFLRLTGARPMLTLKLASSFDGRIATAGGESQWITGPEARRNVHMMRARHDAVMVGAGTVRADDPILTVRGLGIERQPVRIVVSRALDLPLQSRLAASAKELPLWLCHGRGADPGLIAAWQGLGAKTLACDIAGLGLDMAAVLGALAAEGLTRVFCEGGGALAASLLSAGLVDELVGFTAGLVIGAEGQPALGHIGLDNLGEAPRFRLVEQRRVGPDILHRWVR